MKKIYFSLMLAVAALFTSCDMDKAPYGALDENTAVQSMNDVTSFRNGLYGNLRSITNSNWLFYPEVQMDIFHGLINNGNRGGTFSNGLLNSSDGDIEDFFSSMYFVIAKTNYFINKVETMKADAAFADNLDVLNRYQGEARFVRAYCYFWLAEHFCRPYDAAAGDQAALGMPIVTEYNPSGMVETYPSRSTLNETYKLIEDDLAAALTALQTIEQTDKTQLVPEASYLSSNAVLSLQARVALAKKDYATALTKAEQVINSGIYTLVEPEAYADMWSKDTGSEIIFMPFADKNELPGGLGSNFLSNTDDQSDYITTFEMLNLYGDGDVRFDAFFTVNRLNVEGTIYGAYVFNKFPGNDDLRTATTRNFQNKAKVFRLSEIYLIAAESAAASGNAEKANKYLNDLRAKRIIDYTAETYSGTDLQNQIREERLKELIGEGFRFTDLRRWNMGFQRYGDHPENPALNSVIVAAGRELSYDKDDHRFIWPIPSTEMDANPNLKGQQNPGY